MEALMSFGIQGPKGDRGPQGIQGPAGSSASGGVKTATLLKYPGTLYNVLFALGIRSNDVGEPILRGETRYLTYSGYHWLTTVPSESGYFKLVLTTGGILTVSHIGSSSSGSIPGGVIGFQSS